VTSHTLTRESQEPGAGAGGARRVVAPAAWLVYYCMVNRTGSFRTEPVNH